MWVGVVIDRMLEQPDKRQLLFIGKVKRHCA